MPFLGREETCRRPEDKGRSGRYSRRARRSREQALVRWQESQGEDALTGALVCGKAAGVRVALYRLGSGEVVERGVWSCDRVWLCPVCSARRKAARATEVEGAAEAWCSAGGALLMLTLTVRHDASMALSEVLGAVGESWRQLQNRTAFRRLRKEVFGTIRALEITDGENGWHPHIHVLLFVADGITETVPRLVEGLTDDWRSLVGERLGATPSVERALDVRWLDSSAAGYVSKIGKEVALADSKSGRDPFALLDVEGEGARQAGARFLEYGLATKGKQSLVWSPGLREYFGLGSEVSAVELAEAEAAEVVEPELLGWVPASDWNRLVAQGTVDRALQMVEGGWWPSWWPRRE